MSQTQIELADLKMTFLYLSPRREGLISVASNSTKHGGDMEVLNEPRSQVEIAYNSEKISSVELGGQSLVQTIVSLTELPNSLVQQEMNEIIEASGHKTESLTLEQLRVAMLSYLESIQADLACTDEPLTENDAVLIKTPVILD